jgi:hypothetical protein
MRMFVGEYEILIDNDEAWRLLSFKYWPSFFWNNSNPYFLRSSHKKSLYLHREIMNTPKGMICDHRDGNTLDCRKTNLRNCSLSENNRNQKLRKDNTVGLKGVSWIGRRNKYRAQIRINNKKIHLGCFVTKKEAYAAYCEAAKKYHGEFARVV